MASVKEIPSQFISQVLQMPEHSYGVTRVKVTLEDGRVFNDVFVAWGKEIVRVGSEEGAPFDPTKIVAVEHQ